MSDNLVWYQSPEKTINWEASYLNSQARLTAAKAKIERLKAELNLIKKYPAGYDDGLPEIIDFVRIEQEQEASEQRILSLTQGLEKAKEALGQLHDHQNGPPLFKYEKAWNNAMKLTQEAIAQITALLDKTGEVK